MQDVKCSVLNVCKDDDYFREIRGSWYLTKISLFNLKRMVGGMMTCPIKIDHCFLYLGVCPLQGISCERDIPCFSLREQDVVFVP